MPTAMPKNHTPAAQRLVTVPSSTHIAGAIATARMIALGRPRRAVSGPTAADPTRPPSPMAMNRMPYSDGLRCNVFRAYETAAVDDLRKDGTHGRVVHHLAQAQRERGDIQHHDVPRAAGDEQHEGTEQDGPHDVDHRHGLPAIQPVHQRPTRQTEHQPRQERERGEAGNEHGIAGQRRGEQGQRNLDDSVGAGIRGRCGEQSPERAVKCGRRILGCCDPPKQNIPTFGNEVSFPLRCRSAS